MRSFPIRYLPSGKDLLAVGSFDVYNLYYFSWFSESCFFSFFSIKLTLFVITSQYSFKERPLKHFKKGNHLQSVQCFV